MTVYTQFLYSTAVFKCICAVFLLYVNTSARVCGFRGGDCVPCPCFSQLASDTEIYLYTELI